MQRDRMTGQTILRIRPQRGPAAGRTIVMWTNPQLLGEGIQATVDGHTQMAFGGCRSFFICHRAIINRLARDQRVNA